MLVYARTIVGPDMAEDVVSDVFTEIWTRRDTLNFGESTANLLMRSVYNRSINVLKRKKVEKGRIILIEDISRLADADFSLDKACIESGPDIEPSEVRRRLFDALESLPVGSREVFRMSYIYNMRNSEIARIKGISVRTVEAHIYKSLKVLRTKLKDLSNYSFFLAL